MLGIGIGGIGAGPSAPSSAGLGAAMVPGLSPIGGLDAGGEAVTPLPGPLPPDPAPALLGIGLVLCEAPISANLYGSGLLGAALVTAHQPITALLSGGALLGAASVVAVRVFPRAADIPSGVTRYYCRLTGSPDLVLPIKSFSVRHRVNTASYYNVVIPSFSYVEGIAARPLGEIVIWSDTDGVTEELMRGSLGDVRTDRGPTNQSITISGNASRAATPQLTYIIPEALYAYSTFDGEQRLRIKPRAAIRPGDIVQYGSVYFEVGAVTWFVSVSASSVDATMEVSTVAIESDA